jgi:hypothetical protein
MFPPMSTAILVATVLVAGDQVPNSKLPRRGEVPSNRRGFVMLAALAVISAIPAYVHFGLTGDVRWLLGGFVILASWPYAYFVMLPVNIWLYVLPPGAARSAVRELMRDWGLLEWGQTAIGLAACCLFAWALVLPA